MAHEGEVVCQDCGRIGDVPLYQELEPLLWKSAPAYNDDWPTYSRSGVRFGPGADKTYLRYFHFNEVLASITLTGPWIDNHDNDIIQETLRANNIARPGKTDIQRVCRAINTNMKVKRYSQKYSEKWIQIIFRYCGDKPEELSAEIVDSLRQDFRLIESCWPAGRELLKGSRAKEPRIQWPNYNETMYQTLKRKYPFLLDVLKPWLPRLSKKKRRELRNFFNRVFYMAGISR